MPAYSASATTVTTVTSEQALAPADSSPQMTMNADGDATLPDQVAFLPSANPNSSFTVSVPDGAQAIAGNTPQSLVATTGPTDEQISETARDVAAGNAAALAPKPEATQVASAATAMDNPVYVTAGETPEPIAPKKKGFLAAFFGGSTAKAAPSPIVQRNRDSTQQAAKPIIEASTAEQPAKPLVQLASAESDDKPVALVSLDSGSSEPLTSLPGVRQTALFEIKRKSGIDDESDVDLNEDEGSGPINIASAAGLARLAPNGLLKQTESVDVACLKPSLVRVLKTIEGHYGKKLIVTSGYRDPNRNRRARGAKNSLHMYCAAADIQVPGVSKWELANYARSMSGRGGVGTYCHTESVHVDVGPERDWNWRCRRRK